MCDKWNIAVQTSTQMAYCLANGVQCPAFGTDHAEIREERAGQNLPQTFPVPPVPPSDDADIIRGRSSTGFPGPRVFVSLFAH